MASRREWGNLILMIAVFLTLYTLPIESLQLHRAVQEALGLAVWYARQHVILCLVPAFFIAGAICSFISQGSVLRYLGPQAKKVLAYGVASISGSVLAVCSCTVLPLFAGIYTRGAGLGPACAFLYSGPAINILAIVLTAKVLGAKIGIARAAGAVGFCIIIGLLMHLIFRKEEIRKAESAALETPPEAVRPLWKTAAFFASMVAILVFANWSKPEGAGAIYHAIHSAKWIITGAVSVLFALALIFWLGLRVKHMLIASIPVVILSIALKGYPVIPFSAGLITVSIALSRGNEEGREWLQSTWIFAKQMLPLLLLGVVIAGALLGRPGHEAIVPSRWIAGLVGGNSIQSNLVASVAGAFMYFATLTEVPILQGLLGAGMGKGPALALLLAGPALSLPNMLVIRSVMGTGRTVVFVGLIIIMATVSGKIFGTFWG